ncbi:protein of unknown function DUF1254 [Parafrankia sp. EAN1pec]|uniref:DUF1254 domain-containing protein n=1 Tax=Parafrankia sp. (strain EAN1pec) TaxID=298653 RepID=UPI00005424F2|nr:protein of unknown function DUF1254 [Frankia sp. EAN1pec]
MTGQRDQVAAIAVEAYIFAYPLVTMELTRLQATNVEPGVAPGRAPMNQFAHIREFPDADFRMVVRPNFDTLYSSAWVDLTEGPVVVSAPDTDNRYYMLPILDMWTDVFATPGKRSSGTAAADWALVPAGWSGRLPAGVGRIDAPTPHVWIIGRTQTNGEADYDTVHKVQDGFQLSHLADWGRAPIAATARAVDPDIDMTTPPLDVINAMTGEEFFRRAAELMKLHPPHVTDWSQIRRMRALGLVPGESFDPNRQGRAVRDAVAAAPRTAQKAMTTRVSTIATVSDGWQTNTDSIGVYGNYYMKRAAVAMIGLGANPAEEAVYPLLLTDADGDPLDGSVDYVLHFERDELPPVSAFWSITMYDERGFQVANRLNRFALGDRDPLTYNADGSLDLHIQMRPPDPFGNRTGCRPRSARWVSRCGSTHPTPRSCAEHGHRPRYGRPRAAPADSSPADPTDGPKVRRPRLRPPAGSLS